MLKYIQEVSKRVHRLEEEVTKLKAEQKKLRRALAEAKAGTKGKTKKG